MKVLSLDLKKETLPPLMVLSKVSPLTREIILMPVVLVSLFFIGFNEFITGTSSIATFQDNTYLLLPVLHQMSESFSHGEFPYWMNTIMGGLPIYDSPQLSALYPFYFLNFGLYKTPLDALFQVNFVAVFHYLILLSNTYIMLRVFKLTILPSLLGACLLAFSANMLNYSVWLNIIAPYSWFPLIIAGVFLILENKYPVAGIFLGIISLSLLVQASPAQPLIHTVYVIGILYICSSVRYLINNQRAIVVRTTINLVIMGVVGLVIASPVLIPTFLHTKDAIRFIGDFPPIIGDAKIPFEGFLIGQFDPIHLTSALLPLQTPEIIGSSYIGLGAVFLSLFAFFKLKNNWILVPFIFLTFYGLLSATGSNLGFAQINYEIPFINKIREPVRHLFLFVLGAAVLAPFGLTYLREAAAKGFRALFYWKHFLVGFIFLILLAITLLAGPAYVGTVLERYLFIAFAATAGLILLLPLVKGWRRDALVIIILVLVIASSVQYNRRDFPRLQDGDYFSAINLNSIRVVEELSKIEDINNYRVHFDDTTLSAQFWSMNASYYGIRSFFGYMNPIPYQVFDQVLLRSTVPNYYEMLGGKYYVCLPRLCEARKNLLVNYTFQREIEGYSLYSSNKALPHYFLIDNVKGSYKSTTDFYNIISNGYDYANSAYVPSEMATQVTRWLQGNKATGAVTTNIKTESESGNSLKVSLYTKERVIFILNEINRPDWKVKINGVPAQTFNVNLNQTGVLLDRGANLIEFDYKPELFDELLLVRNLVIIMTGLTLMWYVWKTVIKTQRFARWRNNI